MSLPPTVVTHPPTQGTTLVNAIYGGMAYKDESFPLDSRNPYSPASDIYLDTAEGTLNWKTSSRYPTDIVNAGHQLNHDGYFETIIDPHIHWLQSSANLPNALLAYRWFQEGAAPGAWTFVTWADTGGFHEVTYTAGTIEQRSHWPAFTLTGNAKYSTALQFKIWRDVTNVSTEFAGADPLAADWVTLWFDYHYGINKIGSPDYPQP